jgi:predicted RecA/RadA family phage recombinase
MATNIQGDGRQINYTASGNVASGALVVAGQAFGIALISGVSGDVIPLAVGVQCTLPKANAASTSQAFGSNVYWDATNSQCTISAISNTRIGVAMAAAANTDTTVAVRLNGSF